VLFNVLVDAFSDLLVGLALGLGCFDDEGLGDFASSFIGDLNNGTVVDERMGEKMSFELSWCDLVALVEYVSGCEKALGQ
jgi:hypothetical protein